MTTNRREIRRTARFSRGPIDARARLCEAGVMSVGRVELNSERGRDEWTSSRRLVLLYRGTCPRCRFLSRAAVVLSGNGIRRIPNDTAEAETLYLRHGEAQGKLALLRGSRLYVGQRVFAETGRAILWSWVARIPGLGRLVKPACQRGVET